jgi:hypothetical protein
MPHVTTALDNVIFAGAAMEASVRGAHAQVIHTIGSWEVTHVRAGLSDMYHRKVLDLLRRIQRKVNTCNFSDANTHSQMHFN